MAGRGQSRRLWIEPLERRTLLSAPPIILGIDFDQGGQHSIVRSLSVRFSANVGVSIDAADLLIQNIETGQTFGPTLGGYTAANNTATFNLPAMPDGNYRATVRSMVVFDEDGQSLDGNADGKGGDDDILDFHQFFGDSDGDRDVDSADWIRFGQRQTFNPIFDSNRNGRVDSRDLLQFRRNFGKSLSPFTANTSPAAPSVTEPTFDGQSVSGQDVHMEAPVFVDPDASQTHIASDWEIWSTDPVPQRLWSAINAITPEDRIHIHFGNGTFDGSAATAHRLAPDANYILRVRHHDNSGNAATEAGAWAVRLFHTAAEDLPSAINWRVDQLGFKVEEVPFIFDLSQPGNQDSFRLPTNIAFVPNPGPHPDDVLFYVTELYGTIRSVTRNFTVYTFADGVLNYNPTGGISGEGENGLTGITVDPETGDVFATMLYTNGQMQDGRLLTYPKVTRYTSADGGRTAIDTNPVEVGTQGIDILRIVDTAPSPENQLYSHIISNITFGPDGKLYVHNGEGFRYPWAPLLVSFLGKILRMNKDGSPCVDNPFYAPEDNLNDGKVDPGDYIFAYDFRNPFGGAWNAADGMHYEVENGPSTNDRLAKVRRGVNYGWSGTDASMTTNALYNWDPTTAPVNMAFVQQETFGGSGFPADKFGHAFVTQSGPTAATGSGLGRKQLVEFTINTNPDGDNDPTNDNGAIIAGPVPLVSYVGAGRSTFCALAAGPDGLYFSSLYNDDSASNPISRGGTILRVRYVGESAEPAFAPLQIESSFFSTAPSVMSIAIQPMPILNSPGPEIPKSLPPIRAKGAPRGKSAQVLVKPANVTRHRPRFSDVLLSDDRILDREARRAK